MNILFITLSRIKDIEDRGIYNDLIRFFRDQGHTMSIVAPSERRFGKDTHIINNGAVKILSVKVLNIQKTNLVEKGLGTLLIERQYTSAIKKYLPEKFDLILYSTPPITLYGAVSYVKERDNAKTYLLLKDIFPQNAVDLGMMKKGSLSYSFFRKKEKKLYEISDYIGCMSPANVDYVLSNNKEVAPSKVEICPNSIEIVESEIDLQTKKNIRTKYAIPLDSTVFIYGGNLGKPQGLDFLLEVLRANKDKEKCFFLIIGSGTEYPKIEKWFNNNDIRNAKLLAGIPKNEYDLLVQACDVGLIFLDPRFQIPNYPSRLLSYLEYKMPVLMAIDKNTDIGTIAEKNGYGYWTENGNLDSFNNYIQRFISNNELIKEMGNNGFEFLQKNYTVSQSYDIIMNHFHLASHSRIE